jgi:hypothetical protein
VARWQAFALGVAVAAAAAALIMRAAVPADSETQLAGELQARAVQAERQLDATREQLESLSGQLASLTARCDAVAARLDALTRGAAQHAPAATPADTAAEPPATAVPEFQPVAEEEWQALVSGALQAEVERRFGHALPPERQQRLVDALARVRAAATKMQPQEADEGESAGLRQQLTRSIVLMEADRVFREETGIGVTEFLRGLDPEQIQDVPAAEEEEMVDEADKNG